ncbi:hypothetical protein LNI90_11800 [Tenacibaculum dicentrarchi]|uniref:hypothetical protein n=1 Tax=Tenacibaculum finnmarkense TaxID=2781243 RepID=UPI001BE7FC81|nr:hypothetical protein [Tenacibaculum finnmarkense]MCD8416146.1 hypothetical protein [Tenacibaculum dicentrarchi]MCD8421264.1 hypothetical protein [Tenacibaculum dicentrarchi]MCD8438421.1 hypothetical protein [Tenacibaculum dicentrarchi]MCD8452766.1 hypothetical protein [Tenacibaculum dicentrarchi]MCG8829099.1 hypothetical protein [Tenacibaculum dicentrarchi]
MREYLERLKYAKSESEIDEILDEIIPILKSQGISISEIMMYFKMNGNDFEPKSQDHRMTHSNAGKAQEILHKLMNKLKE